MCVEGLSATSRLPGSSLQGVDQQRSGGCSLACLSVLQLHKTNAILSFEQRPSIRDICHAGSGDCTRNRWGKARDTQRSPKRELQQLPKPKEKGSRQQTQVRAQGTAGTRTAHGQGLLQDGLEQSEGQAGCAGCEELQDIISKDPSLAHQDQQCF